MRMAKKLAVINDLSAFGKCSLAAALPVISALKVQACPMATSVLSNQTCYSSYYIKDLTCEMENIKDKWLEMGFGFDGIYAGYLSGEGQAKVIENIVKEFKKDGVAFILDPVMGDAGKVYSNYSDSLRDKLIGLSKKADIVIPNVTELRLLCGENPDTFITNEGHNDISAVGSSALRFAAETHANVVVTGINITEYGKDFIYNIVVEDGSTDYVKSEKLSGGYSGTGDIMASIVSAMYVRGFGIADAVRAASGFISKAIEATVPEDSDVNDGVNFESVLDMLTKI
mgnify:CR=1 FL=1